MNQSMIMLAIAIGVVVVLVLLLLQKKYRKMAAEALLYLVMQAEQQLGAGTGKLKYEAVTLWLHELLPPLGKLLLSPKLIDRLIEEAVLHMKAYLAEQAEEEVPENAEGDADSAPDTGEETNAIPAENDSANAVAESGA